MAIQYRNTQDFDPKALEGLFLSVQWASGRYPDKLAQAMKHSAAVFSAWDGERLVGLVNALDDRVMIAYVHYLLVDPQYQGKGIGKALIGRIKEAYKDYLRIVLVADKEAIPFYGRCGFAGGGESVPMFIHGGWA